MSRNKVGRPPIMTPETIAKLEEAFLIGCTDAEACFMAGISQSAFYRYQENHPEFKDRKEALKENTAIQARREVLEAISNHDGVMVRWYLEKKKPEEFTARQDIRIEGAGTLTIQDREEAIRGLLNAYRPDN